MHNSARHCPVSGVTVGFEMDSYTALEELGSVIICITVYSAGSLAQTRAITVMLETASGSASGKTISATCEVTKPIAEKPMITYF